MIGSNLHFLSQWKFRAVSNECVSSPSVYDCVIIGDNWTCVMLCTCHTFTSNENGEKKCFQHLVSSITCNALKFVFLLLWELALWENNTPIRNIFSSVRVLEKFQSIFLIVSGNPTKNEIPHDWNSPTNVIPPLMLFPHKGNSHTNENPPRLYFHNEWNSPTNVNPRT